tara:strand:+ start:130 stop:591 length:462 start_codon:yes stop_codon:yes gene_type:complete
MKDVSLSGRLIVASCAYCGSDKVCMDRSPIWNGDEWKIPNIAPYSNTLFEYERGNSISTPYTRAYCQDCEGDTRIVFNLLKERDSERDILSCYQVEVMEKVPIDDDGGYDCLYYTHEFSSMNEIESSLGVQFWDRNCEIKIRKFFKEEKTDED